VQGVFEEIRPHETEQQSDQLHRWPGQTEIRHHSSRRAPAESSQQSVADFDGAPFGELDGIDGMFSGHSHPLEMRYCGGQQGRLAAARILHLSARRSFDPDTPLSV